MLVRLGDIVPADVKLIGEQGEHDQPLQARAGPTSLSIHFACVQHLLELGAQPVAAMPHARQQVPFHLAF